MIEQHIELPQPVNARLIVMNGDNVRYYFDSDPEVQEMYAHIAEEQALHNRIHLKNHRNLILQQSVVTIKNSYGFNSDEISQTRMARALLTLDPGETIEWTLADNTIALVTREELREALKLAVQQQTALWKIE